MYTLISALRYSVIGGILTILLSGVPAAFMKAEVCDAIALYNPFIYVNGLGILVAGVLADLLSVRAR